MKPCKLATKHETRAALEAKLGRPIRDGYECCHTCDVRNCIEPEHLWEGTQKQNIRDAINKGRFTQGWGANQAAKTHCPQGHPYSGSNLGRSGGRRVCRECARRASRATYHKRKKR